MKIAFVDEDLSPRTGSRRFTFEVTCELKKRGHDVDLFTTRLDRNTCFKGYLSMPMTVFSKKKSAVTQSVGQSVRGNMRTRDNFLVKAANDLYHRVSQANLIIGMSEKIAESDYDFVVVHYHGEYWLMPYFYHLKSPSGVVYLNVTRPLRPPSALPFQELPLHGHFVNKVLVGPPFGNWVKTSLKKIRMYLGPSHYLLKHAETYGMLGKAASKVVPLGVNHSEFHPTDEEEPFALYVGRIHPHKSLELAIMAMKGTSADASLLVAGDISERYLWYKEKLLKLAERMGISSKVRIIESPSDSEVVRLMQRCSVFLFPSTIDTFGLVALEAMACGKPVIACNRGGVPEVVGDAGFLLEPVVEEWQKTVNLVLSDSRVRRQKGEESLERSEHFSWEKTTERLISSLEAA